MATREFDIEDAFDRAQDIINLLDIESGVTFYQYLERVKNYCEKQYSRSLIVVPSNCVPRGMSAYSTWSKKGYFILAYRTEFNQLKNGLKERSLTHESAHTLLGDVAKLPSIEAILVEYFSLIPPEKIETVLALISGQAGQLLSQLPASNLACRNLIGGNQKLEKSREFIASVVEGKFIPNDEKEAGEQLLY